jgi:RNA polymerase sigma factor (sigma-70 family)
VCVCTECPNQLARDLDGAFAEFLRHHQGLIYGLARRMTATPADAEDLAQETFVRAYRALRGYERERIEALRPRGWLVAIATNVGRNRARRAVIATADLEAVAEPLAEEQGQPERVVERHEEARTWRARLDQLPPRQRRAVELRHVDGLSYPELAEALGRPLGTVKSDVHRGVAALRDILDSEREGLTTREAKS